MNKREHSIYSILTAALDLFREQGYSTTSVRQIAEKAGVSLGMVNHYFGSKEYLGAQVLSLLASYATYDLTERLNFNEDPILFDMVMVRATFALTFYRGYREFYLDSLRHDFFFNYLSSRPTILIETLKKTYNFEASKDDILLYSKYMAYMMEKTLMLKKEEGLFPTIPYEEVPYLICKTSMSPFIPEADIRARDEESKRIAEEFMRNREDCPPDDMIIEFVQRFDATLQQASSNAHSYWISQISNLVN